MAAKFSLNDLLNAKSKATDQAAETSNGFEITMISVHDLTSSGYNFYSLSDIDDLKDSIELLGVQQNLIVQPITEGINQGKYEIIAGHRRRAAVKKLVEEGKTQFEMIPCRIETNPDEIRKKIAIIYTNSTTRELNEWEKIEQLNRLKALLQEYKKTHELPGRIREILAETFHVSPSQVGRMETIHTNLVPELKEELKKETIGFSAAAELSRLSSADQRAIYEQHKETGHTSIKTVRDKKVATVQQPTSLTPPEPEPTKARINELQDLPRDEQDDHCQPCHNALCCLEWAKNGQKAKCDNWDYFKKYYASGMKKIIGAEILHNDSEDIGPKGKTITELTNDILLLRDQKAALTTRAEKAENKLAWVASDIEFLANNLDSYDVAGYLKDIVNQINKAIAGKEQ